MWDAISRAYVVPVAYITCVTALNADRGSEVWTASKAHNGIKRCSQRPMNESMSQAIDITDPTFP